jgi:hypothetical protein
MKWLMWLLVALCGLGVALGVDGLLIEARLRAQASIELRGMNPWIFEELICGSLMLCTYVAAVAVLRTRVTDPPPPRRATPQFDAATQR